MTQLGVVVVAHQSASVIGACLASVSQDTPAGTVVVVVDNASTDGTVAAARSAMADVLVHETGRNAGYAGGINAGLACLPRTDTVLVLNPDVRLRPGAVAALHAVLDLPGIGIAVPRMLDTDGHVQWSLRRRPTVLRAMGEALLGGNRAGRVPALGELVAEPGTYEHPAVADWATGAAMLLSRACLDAVGPWDESFFLYSEETEFALRAADAGFKLRYTPDASVVHLGGESTTSPALYRLLAANRLALYRRTHGRAASAAFRGALIVNESLRAPRGPTHRAALRTLLFEV
ncbi:MAG TPA: glycosyltransferase family 2 protein [Acidimicrobiales bacterium]|jgi:GT2 family glycosyltransferase